MTIVVLECAASACVNYWDRLCSWRSCMLGWSPTWTKVGSLVAHPASDTCRSYRSQALRVSVCCFVDRRSLCDGYRRRDSRVTVWIKSLVRCNWGFHGWLRSPIPSSTSLPKPPSKINFERLAFADAMHSEMGRPERFGDLIVATARWSRSTITSKPSSTFARTAYGSRARSASLMRSVPISRSYVFEGVVGSR
jgi:hypothetical protein